jgi:hypothetical protein
MASKLTAASDSTFCIAVQKCEFKKCRKNGTHHLCISASFSSETGQDRNEVVHCWYCEKHFAMLVPSQNSV